MVLTGSRSSFDSIQKLVGLPANKIAPAPDQRQRQHQRRLIPPEVVELAQAYQRGASMRELAAEFGINRKTVALHLRRLRTPLRRQGLSKDEFDEAIALYQDGWSISRLGERFGCAPGTVLNAFKRSGVERRSPF